jgi:hypothetical protein
MVTFKVNQWINNELASAVIGDFSSTIYMKDWNIAP